jgi:thioesterase domain-containing protein
LTNDVLKSVRFCLPADHFETVSTGLYEASFDIENARNHLSSATKIASLDPAGSYQLAYDAARKSLQAVLAFNGIRIKATGGHYAFVRVAECGIFKDPAWMELREMRRIRNLLEYPQDHFSAIEPAMIQRAIQHSMGMHTEAKLLIEAILEA